MVAESLTETAACSYVVGWCGDSPTDGGLFFPLFESFVVQMIKKGEILGTGISPPSLLPDVSKNKAGVRVYAVVVDCLVGSCF